MTTLAADSSDPAGPGRGRVRSALYWVVSAPVLLETAVGIQWDLARIPYVLDILGRLGFPAYFATILGVSKILALLALFAPRTPRLKEWAYAGLAFVYLGAAACHFAIDDSLGAIVTPAVLAAITFASWGLRPPARRDPSPLRVPRPRRAGGTSARRVPAPAS